MQQGPSSATAIASTSYLLLLSYTGISVTAQRDPLLPRPPSALQNALLPYTGISITAQITTGGFAQQQGVLLCHDQLFTPSQVTSTALHELIHAYDDCRAGVNGLDWADCQAHACSEVCAPTSCSAPVLGGRTGQTARLTLALRCVHLLLDLLPS